MEQPSGMITRCACIVFPRQCLTVLCHPLHASMNSVGVVAMLQPSESDRALGRPYDHVHWVTCCLDALNLLFTSQQALHTSNRPTPRTVKEGIVQSSGRRSWLWQPRTRQKGAASFLPWTKITRCQSKKCMFSSLLIPGVTVTAYLGLAENEPEMHHFSLQLSSSS
ncbi:hypothetical protein KIL84_022133 [Mauremys mutica]|uniref:Uncharacterized protein n=1 Tax=Mauremys mutica TaxID=74926 RepID=A0A9D3X9Q3_9SAUR|nr:hypothetical protein KIL84_022133 [Mauremys mutica]